MNPKFVLAGILFFIPTLANAVSCPSGNQAYSLSNGSEMCASSCNGVMVLNPDGRVVCIKCTLGLELRNNSCVPMSVTSSSPTESEAVNFINGIGSKVFPENPMIGFFGIAAIVTGGYVFWRSSSR